MNSEFIIWVDADACPGPLKNMICRAAIRTGVNLKFVANKRIHLPASPRIEMIIVPAGPDSADDFICKNIAAGDLVITADIPLAAAIIEKKAIALNFQGEQLNQDNIRHILSVRNLMTEMRSAGLETTKHPPFSNRDKEKFANALQGFLRNKI